MQGLPSFVDSEFNYTYAGDKDRIHFYDLQNCFALWPTNWVVDPWRLGVMSERAIKRRLADVGNQVEKGAICRRAVLAIQPDIDVFGDWQRERVFFNITRKSKKERKWQLIKLKPKKSKACLESDIGSKFRARKHIASWHRRRYGFTALSRLDIAIDFT